MKKHEAPFFVLAAVVCVVLFAVPVFAADNFTGTWKLNLQMSQYSPGPPPRGLTSRRGEDAGSAGEPTDESHRAPVVDRGA